jgi:hypothetical protein
MLSFDQLRWRLAEKGYRHRQIENILREFEGQPVPAEVFDKIERFLSADSERVFRTWFGERDYKKRMKHAAVECATGAIASLLDYIRRDG